MTMDISNFYLNTPMERFEYARIPLADIPEEIIKEYSLLKYVDGHDCVYIQIQKGMYGLPQAGILAQELLEKRMANDGYKQSKIIPGLWTHATRQTTFTLVVDDFGVKYSSKDDAQHLINALQEHYQITIDWTGGKYIGITLDWDYAGRKVHLTMPNYLAKALERFNHPKPKRPQNSPHPCAITIYGAKHQYAKQLDTTPLLDKEGKKYVQSVTGTLLYYARAVDATLLVPLSSIAAHQAAPTEHTRELVHQLLDFCATQEDAVLTYHASDMILAVHSDAGYLNENKARSRAGGHFFLSSNTPLPPNNGAILTIAQIIRAVMSSAAEAELGALFINAKEAIYLRQILTKMGHPQPPTPIQTDNSTAEGVVNMRVQPKHTKSMDMRFHWLRDREAQAQFCFYWKPWKTNLADYFTKHHTPAHHRNVRSEFLTKYAELLEFRKRKVVTSSAMTARVC